MHNILANDLIASKALITTQCWLLIDDHSIGFGANQLPIRAIPIYNTVWTYKRQGKRSINHQQSIISLLSLFFSCSSLSNQVKYLDEIR